MKKENLGYIRLKEHHNYVAFFLTLACNLHCHFCINWHGGVSRYSRLNNHELSVEEWIQAANRLILRDDLPLTLQGGEPTLYKGFYKFVNEVKEDIKMDLLTNMMFDVEEFIRNVPVFRFTRKAPYAAIRVSYHPGQNDINDLLKKTQRLQEAGFRIGIYGLLHPEEEIKKHILEIQDQCLKMGIDFRVKEFLGEYKGKIYGTFKYKDAVCAKTMKYCECRTSELIVDPAGYIYRCHADLYKGRKPIAHILDKDFNEEELDKFRECFFYGDCNPCDVKIKTNRFQIFGHTSVEIRNVRELKDESQTILELKDIAKEIRKTIIELANISKSPHVGSSLSCVEILTVLYFKSMNLEPWEKRDIFILSKAHAAMALYITLAKRGIISERLLEGYYQNNGTLPAHLDRFTAEGIEVSAGSLGHGFNMGLGMAYGFKKKKDKRKVYVLIGDGETQEGTIWEGAMFAPKLGIDNFTAIIDYNNLQGYGRPTEICQFEPLNEKWKSFGWFTLEVDGHNLEEIKKAVDTDSEGKPKVIIAHTVKGKGISFMEDQLIWHYYIVTDEIKEKALSELK